MKAYIADIKKVAMAPGKVSKRSTYLRTTQEVANNIESQQDEKKHRHNQFQTSKAEKLFRTEKLQTLLIVYNTYSEAKSLKMLDIPQQLLAYTNKGRTQLFPRE